RQPVNRKAAGSAGIGVALLVLLFFLTIPMLVIGGLSVLFAGRGGRGCTTNPTGPPAAQPGTTAQGKRFIPSSYLSRPPTVGLQYTTHGTVLGGIGREAGENGQCSLPGVRSGQNGFGAAGPMQIGIQGASTNTWGGLPIHPASEKVNGVATDENGVGIANVYA